MKEYTVSYGKKCRGKLHPAFSKIFEEETQTRREDLNEAASGSINAIVSPLGDAIEKQLGPEIDNRALLYELVSFTEIFKRLSPDLTFSDNVIELLTPRSSKGLVMRKTKKRSILS